jgi:DedD protein
MASEDTEITLGVGRLLGLFFLLSALCGVFFSIGYSLGKSTAREQALNDQPTSVLAASPPATAAPGRSEEKPSAAVAAKSDAASPAQDQTDSNSKSNLTFYKAVQQNGTNTESAAKDKAPAVTQKAPAGTETAAANPPSTATQTPDGAGHGAAPSAGRAAPVTGPGTIVVQIAALSREDDAVSLAGALRKKSYNVIVVNNPATNDKFYHVQVGPFATMQEADAMKTKLTAEGYNPIVKR